MFLKNSSLIWMGRFLGCVFYLRSWRTVSGHMLLKVFSTSSLSKTFSLITVRLVHDVTNDMDCCFTPERRAGGARGALGWRAWNRLWRTGISRCILQRWGSGLCYSCLMDHGVEHRRGKAWGPLVADHSQGGWWLTKKTSKEERASIARRNGDIVCQRCCGRRPSGLVPWPEPWGKEVIAACV